MAAEGSSYRILGVLGEGGFGKVYRARLETDTGFTKEVAVKVLHDEHPPQSLLKRFRDEARILGLLRDRAIVGVEPPVKLNGRWSVVMDFIDGRSCKALIGQGPLPLGVALEIIEEIARALHNAYNQAGPDGEPLRLLHRDIKPDNIQVTPTGDICLLDFGIAKADFAEREYKTKKAFGGTPGYIAPERLEGIEHPHGDVFSLGVTLHEMLTGERPKYAAPTMQFTGDEPSQDVDELEIPAELLKDERAVKVLELAGWMRTYDYEQRPSARQVESRCRELRRELDTDPLREWAEEHVDPITEMGEDERTGTTLTLSTDKVSATLAPVEELTPEDAPVRSEAPSMAVGALLGGGTVVLVMMTGLVLILLAVLGWVVAGQGPAPEPAPEPTPVEAPAPTPDPDPEPAPTEPDPAPQPAPVAPTPTPKPPPTVIELPSPGTQPSPSPSPTPTPTPTPTPAPERPTGLVVVKTIPSGATVKERGKTLTKSGAGYRLSPGTHILEIVSPSGESTRIPVEVSTSRQVDICYSFDTNSRCGE